MCNACIMEDIKASMLSRRSLFTGAAATSAAVVASGLVSARPALAAGHGRVVDLTHTLDASFPTFGGAPGIAMNKTVKFDVEIYMPMGA